MAFGTFEVVIILIIGFIWYFGVFKKHNIKKDTVKNQHWMKAKGEIKDISTEKRKSKNRRREGRSWR